jgi:lambda family phage portal protein
MVVAPAIAVRRMANRHRGELMNRKYEGASRSSRTGSFPLNNLSPNKDIGADATLLRQRARYMYQNTFTGKRAINSTGNGVVGTGITAGFRIGYDENSKSDKHPAINTIKNFWRSWAEQTTCDFYSRLNFYGLTKLITKTFRRDGEVLVLRRRVPLSESPIGIQLQVLEMEYLADYINFQVLPNGGWTMNGIEYDKRGKRVAYWLFQRHPSEWYTQPVRVLADDIIHVLHVDFPGQNRGVPAAATTIISERDLDEYEDAELMAKKTQASFAAFRVTNDPDKIDNISLDRKDYDDGEDLEMLEPGTISHLYPGEDIKFSTPPTAPGAEDYRKSKYRAIAAGYEVMYEVLTGDLSNVNFSSYRAGRIDFQQTIEDLQWMTVIPIFCDGVVKWFFEALLTCPGGLVSLPAGINVTWTTPRKDMIDPAKEMGAIKNETRMGRKSWQQMIRENGDDPDEVFKQIVEDKKRFEDAGIHAEWSADLDAVPADAGKLTATGK